MQNKEIAGILDKVALLLELQGENPYRVRAYQNAARTISGLPQSVAEMIRKEQDLTDLSGIGKDMADKLKEIIETGQLEQLRQLEKKVPSGLIELTEIANLGPKRVKKIHDELDVSSIDELEKAAKKHKVRALDGFGSKTEGQIVKAIKSHKEDESKKRFRLDTALEIAEPLIQHLKEARGLRKIDIAGSVRRKKDTIGDIDILVVCDQNTDVMNFFVKYDKVQEVLAKGKTKSSVLLTNNCQADLRIIEKESYGAALMYFTGSKQHNVELRQIAVENGWKMNEYGIFKDDKMLAGSSEEDIYAQFDMAFVPPELREDRGEIKAASSNDLPALVSLEDIRGDLQSHTTASDGRFSLEEMANAARKKGYSYFAITDHSKHLTVARGLDEKRLLEQIDEIEALNEKWDDFRILKSAEVDILEDGSLDLTDDVLKKLDVVICAIHSQFNLSGQKQTERTLKAMDSPYFNIFAHPTGRLIGKRRPYEIDLKQIMEKAKKKRCYLEINAQPDRLDINDSYAKMAKEMGVKVAISTDAHTINELDCMHFGVAQARRGWLSKQDVLNTREWPELKDLLKKPGH